MASSQLDLEAAEAANLLWWMGQGLQQGLVGQWYRGRDTLPGHHLLTCDGGERDIAISVIQGHNGTRGRRGVSKDLQPVPLTLTEHLVYTLGATLEVNWSLTSVLLFLHP